MSEWSPLKQRTHEVIFEAESRAGRLFDLVLLGLILLSVIAVALESVNSIDARYGDVLRLIEWGVTLLFSLEYLLRLWCVRRPWRYAFSFYGVIDLLAIIPTPLALLFPGAQAISALRALRLLRVFRVLHLSAFEQEADSLKEAFLASRTKITVFLLGVLILVVIIGSAAYFVEHREADTHFTSIPAGVYWAIVTLTTVGYGDITPHTATGKALSAFMMLMGYSLIIVPSSLLGAELARKTKRSSQHCPSCAREGHEQDARHCRFCGEKL